MDNPCPYFPGSLSCFDNQGEGYESCDQQNTMLEVVDSGKGFVEIGFIDRNERCYLSFRVSDLLRAIKEQAK